MQGIHPVCPSLQDDLHRAGHYPPHPAAAGVRPRHQGGAAVGPEHGGAAAAGVGGAGAALRHDPGHRLAQDLQTGAGHVTSVSRVTSTVLTRVTCCRSATRRAPSTAWRATRCSAAPSCARRCGSTRRRRCGPPPPRQTSPWPSPTDPPHTSMGDTLGHL